MHSEEKAGLYFTVILHITVIIVLLVSQIGAVIIPENTFVLDFSKQEEKERLIEEEEFKEEISKRLDDLIKTASTPASRDEIRNIAVNANLKDDRGTDAEQLYKDAERLSRELKDGIQEEDMREETVDLGKTEKKQHKEAKEYSGPSVVSYSLDGRKASLLKIPAYRCYGGGDVTVLITVDNSGRVINAKVVDDISSADQCLRNFAVRAARLSRFSASPSAPPRQTGEIVYRFIAQ